MKKNFCLLAIALCCVFLSFASFTLAEDDIYINIENTNTNTNTATANANANAQQHQQQEQQQQQQQAQTMNFNEVREHIMVQPGPQGNFVSAPVAVLGSWQPLLCNPLFGYFSTERIKEMSSAGSFFGGTKIRKVIHESFQGEVDDQGVTLVDWDVREGGFSGDRLLGEFECKGEYGMPMGAALGDCLAAAKKHTNAHRVFAAYKLRRDPKNSGFSIGSGAAGAKMMGESGHVDEVAGAMSLGGLIGTTRAKVDEAYDWTVLALNDGPVKRNALVASPCAVPCEPTPPPTPPLVVCSPEPKVCDPKQFEDRIKGLKESTLHCPNDCYNNMLLNKQLGDAYMDLFYCTGNREFLSEAVYRYERAEKNFNKGKEPDGTLTKNMKGAQELLYKANYNQALAVRELEGREKEISFGYSKGLHRKGDFSMPSEYSDLKR